MAFWRRSKGRHALGAAVSSIQAGAATYAPAQATAPAALDWSFPELQPPQAVAPEPAPEVVRGPRVELTFRDGSSASLDATQARALDEIARVLTRRDGVKP